MDIQNLNISVCNIELENSHILSLMYFLWLSLHYKGRVEELWQSSILVQKAWNIYPLAL